MNATETKAKLLSLLDEVESGEEVLVTRHGRVVARIVPAGNGKGLRNMFAGRAWSNVPDEELFSTGEAWEVER